ncbi:glycoside hydrolase family 43 protein [Lapidilactobacillus bayanensis]|uniref:glycoside hydrolase family 43 protein n=1 Tax=Lapidilactobacillus bayanensis TaxID=2485998 RepID=UPI000F7668C6|nr:glycoside hydrolase family 43 protein [Lapidilactobacillus bayanensis]
MNQNGAKWLDDVGNPIQAHGGMILKTQHKYYWYGENKNVKNLPGTSRVPFVGISCYSSVNLVDWHDEGLVLTTESDSTGTLEEMSIVERPKVIFNTKTQKFVMWTHYDNKEYSYAGCCVAVASSATGPFNVVRIFKPNLQDCRDLTLFEENQKAYLIASSDGNKTLRVIELTADYTDVTTSSYKLFIDQEREAPTVFHVRDWYFTITSGCTGWRPNPALFSRSHSLFTGQKLIDNPCRGSHSETTYSGQPTYIFEVNNKFYLMLDHWNPKSLRDSGYSILPIDINNRDLRISWQQELPNF